MTEFTKKENINNKEEISFSVGEKVKVIDGDFKNFLAVIEEINDYRNTLRLRLKIFGRKTFLELNFIQVEKTK